MFPFKKSCELSFQVCGNQLQDDDQIMMDATAVVATTTSNPKKATADDKQKRAAVEGGCTAGGGGGEDETRRIQRRDTERQRRVVMAGLLNSLRSLLPLQLVKGKRSVSDHIAETANFIKHLQNNITELNHKRGSLRCTPPTNSSGRTPFSNEGASSSIDARCSVSIAISSLGLDVQISSEHGFRLSDPLKVLLEQGGMSVACVVSSKVNGIFHHSIQCQVSSDDIDIQRLQQRLYDVVSSNGSSSFNYPSP